MKIIAPSGVKIRLYLSCSLVFIFAFLILGSGFVFRKNVINASVNSYDNFTVIIDAGHGGVDGGAAADNGTLEKDINLQISTKLNYVISSMGVKTVMIRTQDISIHDPDAVTIRQKKISDLRNRLEIINNTDNAIFVSIHQNHYSSPEYSGAQVFYSDNNELSQNLASSIRLSVISHLQPENNREIKASGSEIYLLNNALPPSVMVECGFLSNKKEADMLSDEEYQQNLSFSIAIGIIDFLNNKEVVNNGS